MENTTACDRMPYLPASFPARADFLSVGIPKLLNGASILLIGLLGMRVLEPAGYGALSFGLACLTMFDALAGAALDLSVTASITAEEVVGDARIRPEEKAAVYLKVLFGAACLAIFGVSGEWLGHRFLHAPGGRQFFLTLAAAGTCVLMLRSMQLYLQARLQFRRYGAADALHGGLRILLAGAVLAGPFATPVAVLSCFAVAPALVMAPCLWNLRSTAEWSRAAVHARELRMVLAGSTPALATFGVSSLVSRLDIFFMALRGAPASLGLYGSALTLATIPETLGAYMAPAFLPRILPACRDGSFPVLFRRAHTWILLACTAALGTALAVGRPVLLWLLPSRYEGAIVLLLILLPGTLAAASYFPLTLNFLMLRNSKVFLVVDCLAAPALVAAYYFLIPWWGVAAAATITCLHRVVKAVAAQTVAARLSHLTIRN